MSYRTEKTYLHWIRRFIRHHNRRHPREMGAPEVEDFLTSLAVRNEGSTFDAEPSAGGNPVFVSRRAVAGTPVADGNRSREAPTAIAGGLSRSEVQRVLARLSGVEWLVVSLLYGSGMRLGECMQLRVKDLDIPRHEILVRGAKGQKDRVTMLPDALVPHLRAHIEQVRVQFDRDFAEKRPGVSLPFALRRKYPTRRPPGRGSGFFRHRLSA